MKHFVLCFLCGLYCLPVWASPLGDEIDRLNAIKVEKIRKEYQAIYESVAKAKMVSQAKPGEKNKTETSDVSKMSDTSDTRDVSGSNDMSDLNQSKASPDRPAPIHYLERGGSSTDAGAPDSPKQTQYGY